MKNTSILKLTIRSIRTFLVRYMALLLITTLSVGFFAGLKITKDAMANTAENFLNEQHLYDFRLISTVGFTSENIKNLQEEDYIASAEGTLTLDAFIKHGDKEEPYHLLSLPEHVNRPSLSAGRMPEKADECLADKKRFTEADLGLAISLSERNQASTTNQLNRNEYTIVGLVDSPIYLGLDRGRTTIGSGSLSGYLYLPKENFKSDVFSEINIVLSETAPLYSKNYDELIDSYKEKITNIAKEQTEARYQAILEQASTIAHPSLLQPFKPEVYILTRAENTGLVNFENDTSIVSGIANIFPLFFILIAMLVCITTMTRMVDEERTQIGVLKAIGFQNSAITAKYLLYAGSATFIGWLAGFFLGTWLLPKIFWYAYGTLYSFSPLRYLFDPVLALLTLGASLLGIVGSAWLSCRKELGDMPAHLIRPKNAKKGKRILLERITPLWSHLSFLSKITLRNMFRYKQRFIMMLIGIGCCAGLVLTAFGVRDSMIHVGKWQFEQIQTYQIEASFAGSTEQQIKETLDAIEGIDQYAACLSEPVSITDSQELSSLYLYSFQSATPINDYWQFYAGKNQLAFPQTGEALISKQAADTLSLATGDTLTVQNARQETMQITISGIFDNYISDYLIISAETYQNAFDAWHANTLLLDTEQEPHTIAEQLTEIDTITSVSILSDAQERIDQALSCLNYIIWMVVAFSGALAFIVIFNLTNINLAERTREIATVEVLGFYPNETESYVLRENRILSIIAAIIGLPLGTLFHAIVMRMIRINIISFSTYIAPQSYLLAFVCTLVFTGIVNILMKRHIAKIQMAESLKAVE